MKESMLGKTIHLTKATENLLYTKQDWGPDGHLGGTATSWAVNHGSGSVNMAVRV